MQRLHLLLAILALTVSTNCTLLGAEAKPLTVSAAASLTNVLREIAGAYRARVPDSEIVYNFAGSGTLQRQIENGAPADVFISAASAPMDELENQNLLLSGSRKNLLTNTLVLIARKEDVNLTDFKGLAEGYVKYIAIGEPRTVPAGGYALECLTGQNLVSRVQSKFVRFLDVRQVLAAVETGNADAGLVYRTDAASSGKVRIVETAPAGSHSPIAYPVAIVRHSRQPKEAQNFIQFLFTPDARVIFEKYGFSTVAP